MNDNKKYELIIFTMFLIGAIISGIFNIYTLVIYVLMGLSIFVFYNKRKKSVNKWNDMLVS